MKFMFNTLKGVTPVERQPELERQYDASVKEENSRFADESRVLNEQLSAQSADVTQKLDTLKKEHEATLVRLKSEFDAANKVIDDKIAALNAQIQEIPKRFPEVKSALEANLKKASDELEECRAADKQKLDSLKSVK